PGGKLEQPWLETAEVDGDGKDELLVEQKNFIPSVVLKHEDRANESKGWTFSVKDQINGASSNSRITGATALRNGSNHVASLFLLDADRKALRSEERRVGQESR